MSEQVVARRRSGYTHDVTAGGHPLVADEPESAGGADLGPSPTKMLAGSLAACTAITIEMYADRKGWDLGDLAVSVSYDGPPNGSDDPSFDVVVHLPGGLNEEQTSRIMTIAAKCPVHKVLASGAEISHSRTSDAP